MSEKQMTHHQEDIWRRLWIQQSRDLANKASSIYQEFLHNSIQRDWNRQIPHMEDVSSQLFQQTGWRLKPVSGLVEPSAFFFALKNKIFPVVSHLRFAADHLDTPDPDLWHDLFGHLPHLLNSQMSRIYEIFGEIGVQAHRGDHLTAVSRLYWYTIEFGLCEESEGLRALGAGLVPSPKELHDGLSSHTKKHKPDLEAMIQMPYLAGEIQSELFVLPSLDWLEKELSLWT